MYTPMGLYAFRHSFIVRLQILLSILPFLCLQLKLNLYCSSHCCKKTIWGKVCHFNFWKSLWRSVIHVNWCGPRPFSEYTLDLHQRDKLINIEDRIAIEMKNSNISLVFWLGSLRIRRVSWYGPTATKALVTWTTCEYSQLVYQYF